MKEGAADGSLIGGEHGGTRTFSVQQLVVFMLPLGSLRAPLHVPMDGWGKKKEKKRKKKKNPEKTEESSDINSRLLLFQSLPGPKGVMQRI